jgi:hypothetical protein
MNGRVKWGPLPAWKKQQPLNNSSGESSSSNSAGSSDSIVEEEWKSALTPDGKTYYW